ncbi:7892_t:CDS:2 [Racocetra fulgida]|uniref:7892_t:CDS:1 n=1 Tax=Racocetra fulgida TaxID=60492 RepID=A0A9N8VHK8_9GLOM|nr:7892_t:CDS:2 [Racocetra fulgida]
MEGTGGFEPTWIAPNGFQDRRFQEITNLDIGQEKLEGDLDLSDFVNLKELDCSKNQITSLILPNKLTSLCCLENKLFTLDISKCLQLSVFVCDPSIKPFQLVVKKVRAEERKKISNIYQQLNTQQPNLEKIKKELLTIQIEDKKNELESLKNTLKSKLDENSTEWLDTFLEAQVALEQNVITFVRNQFNKARGKLKEKLSEEEASSLYQLQAELIDLKKELEKQESGEMEVKIEVK